MGFSALPPEINSTRIYSGPGSGPLVAAATAWGRLASQLRTTAATCSSALATLTSEGWQGAASMAMMSAVAPYVEWLTRTATQAEQTAAQAEVAANAYNQAFAMTVPPSAVAANRSQLATLTATNILGQNTPAIAANEAHYGEMWAQDATAMESYSAMSASATALPQFTPPAQSGSAEEGLVDGDTAETFLALTAVRTGLGVMRTAALDVIGTLIPIASIGSFLVADASLMREYQKDEREAANRSPGVTLVDETGGTVLPTAGLASSTRGGVMSAIAGRASSVGALSVPQAWSTPPEIRQLARALPFTSAVAAPTAEQPGMESPYAGLGLASMAGGGMGGLAGLGASSASTATPTPATTNVAAQKAPKPVANTTAATPNAVTLPTENVAENLAKTLAAMPGATVVVIPPSATSQ